MVKILLVDDDESVRIALRKILERLQLSVTEACNGADALRLCRAEPPDLVLTDLVMPEKEGIETIRDLKREYPGLPVIAMSGGGRNSPQSYLDIAKRLGAVCVLTKPFSVQELTDAIKTALS